jgi:hypothetical protein
MPTIKVNCQYIRRTITLAQVILKPVGAMLRINSEAKVILWEFPEVWIWRK